MSELSDSKTPAPRISPRPVPRPDGSETEAAGALAFPFDPWRLWHALRRWGPWVLLGAVAVGIAAAVWLPKRTTYRAIVTLARREPPLSFSAERPAPGRNPGLSAAASATLLGSLTNPEVLRRVSAKAQPPVSVEELGGRIELVTEDGADFNPDLINLRITGTVSPAATADLANLYANEVAGFTRELQAREAREMNTYLKEALASVDRDLAGVDQELKRFLQEANLFDYDKETDAFLQHRGQLDREYHNARIELETLELKVQTLLQEILLLKQGELDNLLVRYSEEHPLVEERRAQFEVLKRQLQSAGTNSLSELDVGSPVANGLFLQIINLRIQKISLAKQLRELDVLRERVGEKLAGMSAKGIEYSRLKGRLQSLQISRSLVANRQREVQLAEDNAFGYLRPLRVLTVADVATVSGWLHPLILSVAATAFLFTLGITLVLVREMADSRIKTPADLQRVAELPVLATLGDLRRSKADEREAEAFRAWTLLTGKVGRAHAGPLVCGFMASRPAEGCTTWISQMARVARQRGLRVVVLSARPGAGPDFESQDFGANGGPVDHRANGHWLDEAAQAEDKSAGAISVFCPPVDWEWDLARIERWKAALRQFARLEQAVVLVELPPVHGPESVMLAESVPQIVWLSASGLARAEDTRAKLELLRHTRCHLSGAVLNRAPAAARKPAPVRSAATALMTALLAGASVQAQPAVLPPDAEAAESETTSNQFLSVVHVSQRAPWQERLTLGPGDVLNLGLYGAWETAPREVVVGPDGRISFLQASDVLATGLTIDELRGVLQEKLRRFYRNPRVLITPVAFHSKKYFVLGAVTERGVFPLDRPMTIIEAVARAKGLASSPGADRQVLELADLPRSFLVRGGKQAAVDFERLFLEGDLSQNLPLEPNDFLYFAPAARNEVYVLGNVRSPGIAPFTPQATLIGAITARGGFGGGAYRSKVLVVRGSLRRPETYVVNANEILNAKSPDFRLQRKDIIYVSTSPWTLVGQVLDLAISSYIYGVTVVWTGEHVTGAIDTKPYLGGP